ncbi:MAG: oligosaccharide flippase family protein [Alphaproteobacteria bacterium]
MTAGLRAALHHAVRLGPEVFWVSLGNGLMLLGSFVGIKILTSLLPPDEFGLLALGLAIASFLHMLVFVPLGQHTLRFFPVAVQAQALGRFRATTDWAYGRGTVAVIVLAGAGLAGLAVAPDPRWLAIAAMAAPYGLAMGWRARYENQQMAARERRAVAQFQIGDAWLRPALAGGAILLIGPAAAPALLGYGLSTLALALVQARQARPLIGRSAAAAPTAATDDDETLDREKRALLRYCLPAALVAAAGAASTFADRWVLDGLLGVSEVGLYFAIYQIANAPAVLFVGIVTQFFLPIIFGKAGAMNLPEQASAGARVLGYTIASFLVLMAPFIGLALWFGEPIVRFVTGEAYTAYHSLLWIMVCALGLNQLGLILTYKGAYHNRLGLYVLPRLGQAAILIALMVVLVPGRGVAGAAYAALASAAAYVACLVVINRRMGQGNAPPEGP